MIEVVFKYRNAKRTNGKNDYFVYPYVSVIGHSSSKVCAGVSACVGGLRRLIDDARYDVELGKGKFVCRYIRNTNERTSNKDNGDVDTNYAFNTLLCQLYEIYKNYPSSFSKFELIDLDKEVVEEGEENYDERQQKPYRQRRHQTRWEE